MTATRIMHVDDEPNIRVIVRMSLQLDPEITVRSCASGAEALAAVTEWWPDLILLDVMMPDMDGPKTLAMLHLDRDTASIPIVFLTAKAQTPELGYFQQLGAAGVLAKPFDPNTLAEEVRKFLEPKPPGLDFTREEFLGRALSYAKELRGFITALAAGADRADALVNVRQIAHRLSAAGSTFGYHLISADATALEDILIAEGSDADIESAVTDLLTRISTTVGDQLGALVGTGVSEGVADPKPRILQ